MNGRRFRSLKRFDSAIELVTFRNKKGDDIVSWHRSDGNKNVREIAGVDRQSARSRDDSLGHLYAPMRGSDERLNYSRRIKSTR